MEQMHEESRLTVVQAWVVPLLVFMERVFVPVRRLAGRTADIAVAVSGGAVRGVRKGTRAVADAALRAKTGLTRKMVYLPKESHERLRQTAAQLEVQAIIIAGHLDDAEKRIKAYLGIARTLHDLGQPAGDALVRAKDELADQGYWAAKQGRIEAATHYGAMLTELASLARRRMVAFDAYTLTQQYGAMLEGYLLQIRFAVMMSDVAAHIVPCDRPTWLGKALETAIHVQQRSRRTRVVSAVATKMVSVGIAPPTGFAADAVLSPSTEFGDYGIPQDERVEDEPPVSDEELDAAFAAHGA